MGRAGWVSVAVLSWVVACGPDDEPELLLQELGVEGEPPAVGFEARDGDVVVTPGSLVGFVADPDQAASTVPLEVVSDVDGPVWRGNAAGDGTWRWSGRLTPGPHLLEVSAVDREGNRTTATVSVTVRPNAAPICRIESPLPGTVVRTRQDVELRGMAEDADGDELVVLWTSDLAGALFAGEAFTWRFVIPGTHRIQIEAIDELGLSCTDAVLLQVDP